MPEVPAIGADVSNLIPDVGADVSHLMDSGAPTTSPNQNKSWLSSAGDYLGEALASLNPVTMAQGIKQIATHPIDTANSLLQAQGDLERKAEEAFKAGDYKTGARHFINYLIPLLGPRLDQAGDYLAKGEIAKGLGATTDVGLQVAIPKALSSIPSVRTPALLRNPNPVAADAVAFAQSQGIPVDAATATGNTAIRGLQWAADRSIVGSPVAGVMEQRSANALGRVGNELAEKANPIAASSPEQAGAAINLSLEDKIAAHSGEADKYYGSVRSAEAKSPIMVNLAPHKAALRPVFDRLQRQYPVTLQDASPGFKALKNIIEGPDVSPLSQVDADLGTLKSIARGADLPELRTVSQGVAAKAVRELHDAVTSAAAKAGPKVLDDLERGREATRAKYETRAIWDKIRNEPVGAYNQMVLPKDAGIQLLSEVNRLAPTEIPKIGRAFLEDLIGQATSDGFFGKRGTIATKWEKLGPQTKKILFKDPDYIKDLDNFFRYAKMSGINPNPSGTGHVVSLIGQGTLAVTNPKIGIPVQIGGAAASALFRSPAGVNLLTKGLKIPVGNKAAAAAIVNELTQLAGGDLAIEAQEEKQR